MHVPYFNIVAETNENTVVTEYEPVKVRADQYQSEAALEKEFIRMLCDQGYEYLSIHTEKDLIANLRTKLEELNNYKLMVPVLPFCCGKFERAHRRKDSQNPR